MAGRLTRAAPCGSKAKSRARGTPTAPQRARLAQNRTSPRRCPVGKAPSRGRRRTKDRGGLFRVDGRYRCARFRAEHVLRQRTLRAVRRMRQTGNRQRRAESRPGHGPGRCCAHVPERRFPAPSSGSPSSTCSARATCAAVAGLKSCATAVRLKPDATVLELQASRQEGSSLGCSSVQTSSVSSIGSFVTSVGCRSS